MAVIYRRCTAPVPSINTRAGVKVFVAPIARVKSSLFYCVRICTSDFLLLRQLWNALSGNIAARPVLQLGHNRPGCFLVHSSGVTSILGTLGCELYAAP